MDEMVSGGVIASRAADADWWRGAVIYQIYPRSFQDTDGDGVGDLKGIAGRLDHIASLGVDAIWISPFFKSPMKDFGYDVSDYCAVDPLFGTLEDFDHLIAEAHARSIKVTIDQVLSHTSDQHPWFKESRSSKTNAKADWFVWADAKPDGTPPNNWLSIFGGSAWEWDTPLPVLPAQFPDLAAGYQFPLQGGAGCAARVGRVLAEAGRRRLPPRYGELLRPFAGPGEQSALEARGPQLARGAGGQSL